MVGVHVVLPDGGQLSLDGKGRLLHLRAIHLTLHQREVEERYRTGCRCSSYSKERLSFFNHNVTERSLMLFLIILRVAQLGCGVAQKVARRLAVWLGTLEEALYRAEATRTTRGYSTSIKYSIERTSTTYHNDLFRLLCHYCQSLNPIPISSFSFHQK
jgi:hypothetical protein